MNRLLTLALATSLGLSPLAAGPATAQQSVRVQLSGTGTASQAVSIPRGRSAIVDLPIDARDVLVANPSVADAVLQSPRRIVVMGVASGQTDAVFFDASGRQILSLDIRVDAGSSALQDTLHRLVPTAQVNIEAVNDSLILTGSVRNAGESEQVQRIAAQFVSAPDKVLNMLSVQETDQVTVRVRVVEVNRTVIKQLGFNTAAVLGRLGEPQYFFSNAANYSVNGGLLGGVSGGYRLDTTQRPLLAVPCSTGVTGTCTDVASPSTASNWRSATTQTVAGNGGVNSASSVMQAFERVGMLRTLAEPNITTVNGQEGHFLAGGEFPVPVGRDATTGAIQTAYKPYGVSLSVTPHVLSGGRISLQIATEVSELTSDGALTLGQGTPTALTLPGLNVRRSSQTVELPSGGSMMIAGLLQESSRQTIDGLPGAGTLPVLGALFRSRDFRQGETELVIIVEPYLVNSVDPSRLQTPADGLQVASDAQTILFGRLNQASPPVSGVATSAAGRWQGPVGYVIE